MSSAIADAGLSPEDIDYVNAHGTSTPPNDRVETRALKRVFGENVPPVSSTKSMTGHTLGAAGALESVFCDPGHAKLRLPPTINLDNPDPDCDLDYVANKARPADRALRDDQQPRLRRPQRFSGVRASDGGAGPEGLRLGLIGEAAASADGGASKRGLLGAPGATGRALGFSAKFLSIFDNNVAKKAELHPEGPGPTPHVHSPQRSATLSGSRSHPFP